MSSNRSHTTRVYALRLPNEVGDIIDRRAAKQGIKPSEYLRRRVVYDTLRKHVHQFNKEVTIGSNFEGYPV